MHGLMHNVGSQLIVSVAPVSVVFCGGMDPKLDRLETSGEIWARAKPGLVIINCQHYMSTTGKDWWMARICGNVIAKLSGS